MSVSGTVYQALDEPELRFRPVGAQSLKNIPGTVHVYEFSDLPATTSRAAAGACRWNLPPSQSSLSTPRPWTPWTARPVT